MKSDFLLTPILADEVSTGGVIVSRIILALRYIPKYIRRLMAGVCLPLRTSGYKSRHTINQASERPLRLCYKLSHILRSLYIGRHSEDNSCSPYCSSWLTRGAYLLHRHILNYIAPYTIQGYLQYCSCGLHLYDLQPEDFLHLGEMPLRQDGEYTSVSRRGIGQKGIHSCDSYSEIILAPCGKNNCKNHEIGLVPNSILHIAHCIP